MISIDKELFFFGWGGGDDKTKECDNFCMILKEKEPQRRTISKSLVITILIFHLYQLQGGTKQQNG